MKIYLINYADENYSALQKLNTKSAKRYKVFSDIREYCPDDIDNDFKKRNISILSEKRGAGYWLWKPYIVNKTLKDIDYGDFLLYCDSGGFFINSPLTLIEYSIKNKKNTLVFELPFIEKHWTKRDVFVLMECDSAFYANSNQRLASYFLIRKTIKIEKFIEDWLSLCQHDFLITDKANTLGKSNYDGFIENRHDQSIFSLLTKKYRIEALEDNTSDSIYQKAASKRSKHVLQFNEFSGNSLPVTLFVNRNRQNSVELSVLTFISQFIRTFRCFEKRGVTQKHVFQTLWLLPWQAIYKLPWVIIKKVFSKFSNRSHNSPPF